MEKIKQELILIVGLVDKMKNTKKESYEMKKIKTALTLVDGYYQNMETRSSQSLKNYNFEKFPWENDYFLKLLKKNYFNPYL